MARKIKVKSALKREADGGFKVALYEKHEAHKDGEAFIADDKVHNVAATPGVMAAIQDGRLIDVAHAKEDEEASSSDDAGSEEEDESESTGSADDDEAAIALFVAEYTPEQLRSMATDRGLDVSSEATPREIAEAIIAAE